MITKENVLTSINKVVLMKDYELHDCIFSQKYGLTPVILVYVLQQLSKDFCFKIDDNFIDSMKAVTFKQFEELLEQYNTN